MPIGASAGMMAAKVHAFDGGTRVRVLRRAQDCQAFNVDVGSPKDTQHRPFVMSEPSLTWNTDKIRDRAHVGPVPVARIEADLDLGIIWCVNRIRVGRRA